MRDFVRRHRRRLVIAGLVLVSLVGLGLPERAASRARGGVGTAFAPAQWALSSVGRAVGSVFRPLSAAWRRGRSIEDLQAEVARLRSENAQLVQALARREWELAEVVHLTRTLPVARLEFISAPVIGRDTCTWADSVTVPRGSRSGVRRGQLVLLAAGAGQGIEPGHAVLDGASVVGRVTVVGPFHSVVRLVTDPSSAMRAQVVGFRDGKPVQTATGILQGAASNRATLSLRYVRRSDDVRPGDVVLTAGYGGVLPAPLVVGRVERVEPSTMPLLSAVTVAPAADLDALRRVIIVRERRATAAGPVEDERP